MQRRAGAQALDQVGIGDEGTAKGDEVGEVAAPCLDCQRQIVAVVGDIEPLEETPQHLQVEAVRHLARALRRALDDVEIDEVEGIERRDRMAIGGLGVAVGPEIVGRAHRREADADPPPPQTPTTASATSSRKRTRFSREPP